MKKKILIVEDDPNIALGLETLLTGEGFEVATCNRGDKALEAVAKHHSSLIILDVMLPGANGFEICKQLRARKIPIPILMLTAKGQELDKVIGLEAGADDYVTKPFGVRELVARIHALLRRVAGKWTVVDFMIGPTDVGWLDWQTTHGVPAGLIPGAGDVAH